MNKYKIDPAIIAVGIGLALFAGYWLMNQREKGGKEPTGNSEQDRDQMEEEFKREQEQMQGEPIDQPERQESKSNMHGQKRALNEQIFAESQQDYDVKG